MLYKSRTSHTDIRIFLPNYMRAKLRLTSADINSTPHTRTNTPTPTYLLTYTYMYIHTEMIIYTYN